MGYSQVGFIDIGAALGSQAMEKVAFNLAMDYIKNTGEKAYGTKVPEKVEEEVKEVAKPGRVKRLIELLKKHKGKAALGAAGAAALGGLGYGAYRLAKD